LQEYSEESTIADRKSRECAEIWDIMPGKMKNFCSKTLIEISFGISESKILINFIEDLDILLLEVRNYTYNFRVFVSI